MRVVFMGTPDFAVPSLERLISDEHDVVGVFTQPDKPKGRGYTLTPPPVKECALSHEIPVFQPTSVKNGEAMPILNELKPDVIVVAAFGMLLKEDILNFPKYGCINAHASLLPKYRGAAPIQRAIINGDEFTGVTAMQMNAGLDTGDMLYVKKLRIDENENSEELFNRLARLAADVVSETLIFAEKGLLNPVPQDENQMVYAKMLSKAECPINFEDTANNIHNKIRGLSPWPVATANFFGEVLKIHQSRVTGKTVDGNSSHTPGELIFEKNHLYVVCGDLILLELLTLQLPGAKRLGAADFVRGHNKAIGAVLN